MSQFSIGYATLKDVRKSKGKFKAKKEKLGLV